MYNQYHLYFLPDHLKLALIRSIRLASDEGLSIADFKALLLPPPDIFDDDSDGEGLVERTDAFASSKDVTYLDLSGSIGRSIRFKELAELLFPARVKVPASEPQESWDTAESTPSPPRILLPNLTHLSLAANPHNASNASWKQLLAFSAKLSGITHLSLAYWPDPCLTPRARYSSVVSPQGNSVPYGGTNFYSHSLDHDWSEALLVLRMLSKTLYALEYLDLTGCSSWFKALMVESEHDYVDWAGNWGKITTLRLHTGWQPGEHSLPSEKAIYRESVEMAARVEKHIRAMRAGKGRSITVERNILDNYT